MLVNNGESITFQFSTYDPDTGASKNADEAPTITVYDAAGSVVGGGIGAPTNPAIGSYSVVLDTGSMIGLTIGKEYIVRATAKVTGSADGATQITASTVIGQFQLSGVNHGKDLVNLLDGKTPQEALRYMAAVLAGRITTAGQATERFLGLDESTPRVDVVVDATGNRSDIVYDP